MIATSPADAKTKRHKVVSVPQNITCGFDHGENICPVAEQAPMGRKIRFASAIEHESSGVRFIPNPPGTWRVAVSCAHRLAAYWGLGKDLDSVSVWPKVFPSASGPGIRIAAVRRDLHHVIGIVGGGPGAWEVVDFNSGGHKNRAYTISNFSGYRFVDTRSRSAQLN